MVTIAGITYTAQNSAHDMPYGLPAAVHVQQLGSFLSAGDTVRISAYEHCPSIIGRIIDIVEPSLNTDISRHPYIDVNYQHQGNEKFVAIQLYLVRNNCDTHQQFWPPIHSAAQRRATIQIAEAARSNLVVLAYSRQITDIVWIPHIHDCVNHVYGSVVGRDNTYYLRYQVLINWNEEDEHSLS